MNNNTDSDFFLVQLPAGKTLTSTMTPNSSSDYDLYVYNSSGSQLTSSTNSSGLVDSAKFSNTGASTMPIYVRVIYYGGGTGATSGKYALKLSW
jgi:serine protease